MEEVRSFLVRFPPFDALETDALERVSEATQTKSFPRGTTILHQGGPPSRFLHVVRTGGVELLDGGAVIDLLEEGELFGHPSLVAGLPPEFGVRAFEDTICYLIDRQVAEEVLETRSGIEFLARGLARRSRQMVLASETERIVRPPVPLSTVLHREAIWCAPTVSVREAASTMAREAISSILVRSDDLLGIVTDRDLRSKVVAQGKDLSTPVSEVMTTPVITVRDDALADEALRLMLEHGIHHLPVKGADGLIAGVVSDTDLMGLERSAPFTFLRSIDRAGTTAEVVARMSQLPAIVIPLVETETDPVDVGHVIASAIDATTRRLIHVAIAELGDPPGPWAWIGLGSEARHEQSLVTDQDHALVFVAPDVPAEEADGYFERLARRVTDGLAEAGIPRCRGHVMAESAAWRADRETWVRRFREQLALSDIGGTAFSNIALDYRRVAGALDIEPTIDALVREAAAEGWLVRKLASSAMDLRPPTGFFRDLLVGWDGSRARTFDVKHGGITPITNLARTFAVASGAAANRTIDRLRAASSLGHLDPDLAVGLEEAFRLLWRIRLRHQASQIRAGDDANDEVDPRQLGRLTRRSLREAFKLVTAGQRVLSTTYGLRVR
jgi:CBS domain-containing protein